jgi:hypothetical protein
MIKKYIKVEYYEDVDSMPVITRFYGIVIKIYPNDHLPPRFHAIYG